jgi:hypothetical protein
MTDQRTMEMPQTMATKARRRERRARPGSTRVGSERRGGIGVPTMQKGAP